MSDDSELKRRVLQVQQNQPIRRLDSANFQKAHLGGVKPESRSQSVTQSQIQESEEIDDLEFKVQWLEREVDLRENNPELARAQIDLWKVLSKSQKEIVALESQVEKLKKREQRGEGGKDFLQKAQKKLEQTKVKAGETIKYFQQRAKDLKELYAEDDIEGIKSELSEAKKELQQAQHKLQESEKKPETGPESKKPSATELNDVFQELRDVYPEMLTAIAKDTQSVSMSSSINRYKDKADSIDAVLKFDQISAAFKKDFLNAELKDQAKLAQKAGLVSTLDKRSAEFKKPLQMESDPEVAELEGKFTAKVQEVKDRVQQIIARRRSQRAQSEPRNGSSTSPAEGSRGSLREVLSKDRSQSSSRITSASSPRRFSLFNRNNNGVGGR